MSRPHTREIFEECLSTGKLDPDVVGLFVRAQVPEDLHLDYKGGQLVSEKNTAKLRSAVAGFANGEGGLLLLGVNGSDVTPTERRWQVDGCDELVGNQPLTDWIATSLRELAPYLHPYPKVGTTRVGGRLVAFVATSRSGTLVPVVESGKGLVHYLRFFGTTQPAPPYLLADLLLGRRQRPVFVPTSPFPVSAPTPQQPVGPTARQAGGTLTFSLNLRNASFIWASNPTAGVIGASIVGRRESVPPELMASVDGNSEQLGHLRDRLGSSVEPFATWHALKVSVEPPDTRPWIEAYELAELHHRRRGRLASRGPTIRLKWLGASYVYCENATPDWFQVEVVHVVRNKNIIPEAQLAGSVHRPARLPVAGWVVQALHLHTGGWIDLDFESPEATYSSVGGEG